MYCPSCGIELEGKEKFCGECGRILEGCKPHSSFIEESSVAANSIHVQTIAKEAMPVQAELLPSNTAFPTIKDCTLFYELARQREQSEQIALYHQQEADFYKKSLLRCLIVGIVLGFLGASAGEYAVATLFLLPFGMAPVMRFINSHSWFIIFSWVFLIVATAILLTIAIIAGPIYCVYALIKVSHHSRTAKRSLNQAAQCAYQISQL